LRTLNTEQWDRVKAVLDAALALPPERREACLAEAERADPAVAAEARSLLAAYAGADETGSLESPFVGTGNPLAQEIPEAPTLPAGQHIGAYRLLGELGRGGMGVVYLAERSDGLFQRRVAIKVLRQGVGGEEERRFLAERRILARLDHPGIARLIDAGTTSDRQPYLVMELVEGRPITEYCEAERLDVERRLELFRIICEAVQFAHGHLVIHRDLKPSNILVDAEGQVKLLDFGIAKLLEEAGEGEAALTRTGLRQLTLAYASPEQLLGRPITVASDVYALGLLLYELLCGYRPLNLERESIVGLENLICRTDPLPPSRRLRAEAEGGRAERLARVLRGDLDLIVMKALRKEPERRYHSVAQLVDDLGHYRRGEPVMARPGTRRYRLSKFWQRHRGSLISAGLVLAALVVGLVATVHKAREADRRFAELRGLSNSLLFELHDEIASLQGTVRMRELLVNHGLRALEDLSRDAGDDPGLLAELAEAHRRVGEIRGDPKYINLGDLDAAREHYRQSVALRERLLAEDPADPRARRALAEALDRLAQVLSWDQEHGEALALNARAVELTAMLLAERPGDVEHRHDLARFRSVRAWMLIWSEGIREGAELLTEVEPVLAELAREHPGRLDFQLSLWDYCRHASDGFRYQGDLAGARVVLDRGREHLYAIRERFPDHPRVLTSLRLCLIGVGELQEDPAPAEARRTYAEGLVLAEQQLRRDPENREAQRGYASLLGAQGSVLQRLGRFAEAEDHMMRAFAQKESLCQAFPENPSYLGTFAVTHWRLTHLHLELGSHETSLDYARRLVAILEALDAGEQRSDINAGLLAMAQGLLAQVHLDRARHAGDAASRRADLANALKWFGLSLERFERQKAAGTYLGENDKHYERYGREREEVRAALAAD